MWYLIGCNLQLLCGATLKPRGALSKTTIEKIVDLFLRFNRRMNFAVQKVPHEVTINESHVLMEIGFKPGIFAKEICELLFLDKSIVSRTISRLEKRKLLRRLASPEDRREKRLELSATGKNLVKRDSQARNQMATQCCFALDKKELSELCDFLNRIGENLGAHPIEIRDGDEPIKISIRKLTRSMGFLGDNVLASGLPIEKLQILYNLHIQSPTLSMAKLRRLLPYEVTALSRLISDLEGEGLVNKEVDSTDKRFLHLALTPKGKRIVDRGVSGALAMLSKGISNFSEKDTSRLVDLLETFLMIPDFVLQTERDRSIEVREISSDEERHHTRVALVEAFVGQKRTSEIPQILIDPDTRCFAMYRASELLGLCEVSSSRSGSQIEELVVLNEDADKENAFVLFERALREGLKHSSATKVSMPSSATAAEWFEPLADHALSTGEKLIFTPQTHSRVESLVK